MMQKPLEIVAAEAQHTPPTKSSSVSPSKGWLFTYTNTSKASSYDTGDRIFYVTIMILLTLIFPANWVSGTGIAVYGEHINDGLVCFVSLYFLALGTCGFTYFIMVVILPLNTRTQHSEALGKLEARGKNCETSKPARIRSYCKSSHCIIALINLHLCPIVLAIFVIFFIDKIPEGFLVFTLFQAIVSTIFLCLFSMSVSAKGGLYLWKKYFFHGRN